MESLTQRLFRGTRQVVIYEEVEVFADSYDKAREMIEDDDETVKVISERESDYEISGHLVEVKI